MPRTFNLVLPGPEERNDTDGTEVATSVKSATPVRSRESPESAEILMGMSCSPLARLVAVTTTSSSSTATALLINAPTVRAAANTMTSKPLSFMSFLVVGTNLRPGGHWLYANLQQKCSSLCLDYQC